MDIHLIGIHIECNVTCMQEVICEIFFDYVPLVSAADDEFSDIVVTISLEDVPKDRFPTHFNHGLGPQVSLFGEPRAEPTSKYDRFQIRLSEYYTTIAGMRGLGPLPFCPLGYSMAVLNSR